MQETRVIVRREMRETIGQFTRRHYIESIMPISHIYIHECGSISTYHEETDRGFVCGAKIPQDRIVMRIL